MEIIDSAPEATEYSELRQKAGLSAKSLQAAEIGLANSLYAVHIRIEEKLAAMGRVVGDGACFFQIVDIAVAPEHQGRGLGKVIMERIESYLNHATVEGSYVSLIADQPEFYRKLGYKFTEPAQGMYKKF
ncbi:MAG: GNAT family N-acetyltransferase [Deferribacteres bacterium]|nr:GNAT family N-acetyltransferase [candidate division KSB1 bacterium]MCB9503638.1 GNAT family N-acetyltransferase [Deferribacteres bacterium]